MADSDQILKLLVQFDVVRAADVKAAQEMIAETGKAAQKTGDAHEEMGKGIKKAGEAAEESGISHRELRHTLLEIGNVAAPGAGHALAELAMGPIGAVLALVSAFEMLKRNLEDADKEADKLADALSEPMDGGVNSVATAWENAAKRMGEYFAKMADAGKDKDPEATELKRIKEITDAEVTAAKQRIQALAEVQEAQLKASGATPETIAALKLHTEEQLKALDQQKDHAEGVALLQKEQNDRLAKTQALYAKTKETSDAAKEAERRYNQDNATLANAEETLAGKGKAGEALQKQQEDAQKKLTDVQAAYEREKGLAKYSFDPAAQIKFADKIYQPQLAAAQEELDRVQRERDRLQRTVNQLGPEGNQTAREAALKEAQQAAADAAEANERNKARLVQLPAEIDQANKVEGIKNAGDSDYQLLKRGAGAIAGDAAATHQTIQAAMAELKANQKITQELAAAVASATTGHREVATALKQTLDGLVQAQATLARQIASGNTNFGR